jgi:hypothetical protein
MIFDQFTLHGRVYYRYNGSYYVDNYTVREKITTEEFKDAMMDCLIINK